MGDGIVGDAANLVINAMGNQILESQGDRLTGIVKDAYKNAVSKLLGSFP